MLLQIFTLLGALGMFLYGMNMMSSGLQKAAGNRLRGFLTAMTSNPFKGVMTGLGIIAVDSSVIPLGSLLYIDGYGYAIAADTGGAIHGNIIDLYLNSYDECINWGRQNVTVNLIAYPGQW